MVAARDQFNFRSGELTLGNRLISDMITEKLTRTNPIVDGACVLCDADDGHSLICPYAMACEYLGVDMVTPADPRAEMLDSWQHDAWQTAEDKGWHEPREIEGVVRNASTSERIALIHSEASEALEEVREGRYDIWYQPEGHPKAGKPEGAIVELADIFIRLLDTADELHQKFGTITLAEATQVKMAYNEGRSFRHGGKNI